MGSVTPKQAEACVFVYAISRQNTVRWAQGSGGTPPVTRQWYLNPVSSSYNLLTCHPSSMNSDPESSGSQVLGVTFQFPVWSPVLEPLVIGLVSE